MWRRHFRSRRRHVWNSSRWGRWRWRVIFVGVANGTHWCNGRRRFCDHRRVLERACRRTLAQFLLRRPLGRGRTGARTRHGGTCGLTCRDLTSVLLLLLRGGDIQPTTWCRTTGSRADRRRRLESFACQVTGCASVVCTPFGRRKRSFQFVNGSYRRTLGDCRGFRGCRRSPTAGRGGGCQHRCRRGCFNSCSRSTIGCSHRG